MAKTNTGTIAGLAGGAAVAAAAAYWLYGADHAKKHRQQAKAWMLRARAEVLEGVEKLQNVDKAQYLAVVDSVVKGYSAIAGTNSPEMKRLVADLRDAWKYVNTQKGPAGKRAKKVGTSAKRAGRSVVRKAKAAVSKVKKARR